jgi:3-oxoacyl-[acyl-carrier protein] reductase
MIWLTKAIAKELAPFNIKVNAVSPGLIDTSMGKIKNEDQMSETINKTALSRLGRPKEISDAILFLMSNNASFITGHILKVDGGRL